jgi:hypothetical protein
VRKAGITFDIFGQVDWEAGLHNLTKKPIWSKMHIVENEFIAITF